MEFYWADSSVFTKHSASYCPGISRVTMTTASPYYFPEFIDSYLFFCINRLSHRDLSSNIWMSVLLPFPFNLHTVMFWSAKAGKTHAPLNTLVLVFKVVWVITVWCELTMNTYNVCGWGEACIGVSCRLPLATSLISCIITGLSWSVH